MLPGIKSSTTMRSRACSESVLTIFTVRRTVLLSDTFDRSIIMKLALIGIGQAGGKIADAFLARDRAMPGPDIVHHALAINTAQTDLAGLSTIPEAQRLLIGETEVGGHGVGGDNELAAHIIERELDEVHTALNQISVHEVNAFLIIAALGGGTGSGASPVLATHLQEIYAEPVYGLGILPAADEGGIYTLNAARSLQTLVDRVDNLILFDNDAWRNTGEAIEGGYEAMNRELVTQVELPFRAGEIEEGQTVAESVVDSSEIINTLSGGGVSTIGYADDDSVQSVESGSRGLLSRFSRNNDPPEDSAVAVNRIMSLVRRATLGRLTVEADVGSAERGLVVVAGPSEYLNRKGIERGRSWLEEETASMHIRGGDYPWSEDRVAVSVLLAGVSSIPRIEALKHQAVEAQSQLESTRANHDAAMDSLSTDELDSLF